MPWSLQQMVFPAGGPASCSTADPVTGNRRSHRDASYGLGEALVSGLVNPGRLTVRHGEVVARRSPANSVPSRPASWRYQEVAIDSQRRSSRRYGCAGRRLVRSGGGRSALRPPADIEWCLVDDGFASLRANIGLSSSARGTSGGEFQIVRAPITTLFPIPRPATRRITFYVSVVMGR